MKAFRLENKIAVITGGGSGIGFAIAKTFIDAGAKVIILGRTEEKLVNAQNELGEACDYIPFDITVLDKIPDLVTKIEETMGPVDILVNNAGTHLKKYAVDTTDQEFQSVLNVHLMSVFALTREFAKKMVNRKPRLCQSFADHRLPQSLAPHGNCRQ